MEITLAEAEVELVQLEEINLVVKMTVTHLEELEELE